MRKMNVVFAAAAVLLAFATIWLVMADWNRTWRQYQRDAAKWEYAMTEELIAADSTTEARAQLDRLKAARDTELAAAQARLSELEQVKAQYLAEQNRLKLPLAKAKGEIGPVLQLIERAIVEFGPDSQEVREKRKELSQKRSTYNELAAIDASLTGKLTDVDKELAVAGKQVSDTKKLIDSLERSKLSNEEKLQQLSPDSPSGWLASKVRNAPLLDWLHASETVQQQVVPDVLTDYNFVKTETIDRCMTCHVNIANPRYESGAMISFIERQLAKAQGQQVDRLDHAPVVMIDFWQNALAADDVMRVELRAMQLQTYLTLSKARADLKASDPRTVDLSLAEALAAVAHARQAQLGTEIDALAKKSPVNQAKVSEKEAAKTAAKDVAKALDDAAPPIRAAREAAGKAQEAVDRAKAESGEKSPAYTAATNALSEARRAYRDKAGALTGQLLSIVDDPAKRDLTQVFAAELAGRRLVTLDEKVTQSLDATAAALVDALTEEVTDVSKAYKEKTEELNARYAPIAYYRDHVRQLAQRSLDAAGYKALVELYRRRLIMVYNDHRAGIGLAKLSDNPVLLGHSQIDLFVSPDSVHPMVKMGCTVCHEGSGQETQFEHTAHTPRHMWVDRTTGAPVPDFLIRATGDESDMRQQQRVGSSGQLAAAPSHVTPKSSPPVSTTAGTVTPAKAEGDAPAPTAAADKSHDKANGEHGAHGEYSHRDVNLNSPGHPAPFAPERDHGTDALYVDPSDPGHTRLAVRQEEAWERDYGYHEVHYMHWEKPMHALNFVQSSCSKCHTEVFDVRDSADKLVEGRKLFAQLGCANCHTVTDLEDDLDVKRVGPDLTFLGEKLSPQMTASWIWSPKAFRPTSRMPHFFMLENNSSPVDILRTRTEVSAITYYLMNAKASPQQKIDTLLTEEATLKAELEKGPTPTRKTAIDARLDAINNEIIALEDQTPRYQPELPPLPHRVEAIAAQVADLKKQLEGDAKKDDAAKTDAPKADAPKADAAPAAEAPKADAPKADAAPAEDPKAKIAAQIAELEAAAAKLGESFKPGDAAKGREVFNTVGCRACHSVFSEDIEPLIVADLMKRQGMTETQAQAAYDGKDYNQRHWYVLEHLRNKVQLHGPELSGAGTKLLANRTEKQAQGWLYDWLRDPRRYHSYTFMPSFRLSEQEAMDVAAYILTLQRPGAHDSVYQPDSFGFDGEGQLKLDDDSAKMLEEVLVILLSARTTADNARKELASVDANKKPVWPVERRLMFVGQKMIANYGCASCHKMNGFEENVATCAKLDDWGLKDPHKLDFAFFDHALDDGRGASYPTWKVEHEGLTVDAPSITYKSDKLEKRDLEWEHIHNTRRPWLYNKLHNPRVYDRGKYPHKSDVKPDPLAGEGIAIDLGRPYDKLKMPKFFLADDQVRALVTFVTSVRAPLVKPSLQVAAGDAAHRVAKGRQAATMYNCYACHAIDGNNVPIQKYFDVWGPLGSEGPKDSTKLANLMNAPPSLRYQGMRTQPDWLIDFLQDVQMIRPWVNIRMPSFFHDPHDTKTSHEHTQALADYFAGNSQRLSKSLTKQLEPIHAEIQRSDTARADFELQLKGQSARVEELKAKKADLDKQAKAEGVEPAKAKQLDDAIKSVDGQIADIDADIARTKTNIERLRPWFERENAAVMASRDKLAAFAVEADMVPATIFDPQVTASEDRKAAWAKLVYEFDFLARVNNIAYPFPAAEVPQPDDVRFARGEGMFNLLGCTKCHALGDYDKLWALWDLQKPTVAPGTPGAQPEKDPFGADDPFADDKPKAKVEADPFADDTKPKADAPKAADDPFGADPSAPAPGTADGTADGQPPAPTGPAWLQAPNLNKSFVRLQRGWIDAMLQEPNTLIPGNKMPQWFKNGGESYFKGAGFPPDMVAQYHRQFGFTGKYQRDMLIDFLFLAGRRDYTPGEEALLVAKAGDPSKLTAEERALLDKLTAKTTIDIPLLPEPVRPARVASAAAQDTTQAGGTTTTAEPVVVSDKSTIELQDEPSKAFEGTRIVGVVNWGLDKIPPRKVERQVGAVADCAKMHPDHLPYVQSLIVTDDKKLQNAFIYVKAGLEGKKYEMPKKPQVIDQQGCIYVPHVMGVVAGQPFQIHTNDPFLHNVRLVSKLNGAFSDGMPVKGMVLNKTLSKPEMAAQLRCDVHPWMGAYIHVMEHPFFATSDVEGRFEIKGLPPGKYTLEAIHENAQIKPVTFEIEVKDNTSVRSDVTMAP